NPAQSLLCYYSATMSLLHYRQRNTDNNPLLRRNNGKRPSSADDHRDAARRTMIMAPARKWHGIILFIDNSYQKKK
ncbi:TPA: hypothetical protein ACQWI5_003350, partial [Edwardsiella piscicida]